MPKCAICFVFTREESEAKGARKLTQEGISRVSLEAVENWRQILPRPCGGKRRLTDALRQLVQLVEVRTHPLPDLDFEPLRHPEIELGGPHHGDD